MLLLLCVKSAGRDTSARSSPLFKSEQWVMRSFSYQRNLVHLWAVLLKAPSLDLRWEGNNCLLMLHERDGESKALKHSLQRNLSLPQIRASSVTAQVWWGSPRTVFLFLGMCCKYNETPQFRVRKYLISLLFMSFVISNETERKALN